MTVPVGYAEMSIEYRNSGDPQPWYNVFGVAVDLATQSAQEHVDHVAGVWYGALVSAFSTSTTLNNVIGRFGQDGGDPVTVETSVAPLNGTGTGQKLPQNCALLVRKQTSLGGRRGRGRIFVPNVLDESEVTNTGVIGTSTVSGFQSIFTDILDDLAAPDVVSGAETPMVLLHSAPSLGAEPLAPTLVNSVAVDSVIATQRRRLRK
jgi:hypothetical protein